MKKLAILSLAAIGASANAALLFDNGPVTNGVGNGAGGANTSSVLSGGSNYAPGAQGTANTRVADNFNASTGAWIVQEIRLYAYQTNSTAFTFNRVRATINANDSGNPGTAVHSVDTTSIINGGFVGYRVLETALTNTQRPIYEIRVTGLNWVLNQGTDYWLAFSLWGTLSSGPWVPPVAGVSNGDAKQSLNGGAWTQIVDTTRIQNGQPGNLAMPFQLHGVVPEPGTMIALGAGLAALAARRRRK